MKLEVPTEVKALAEKTVEQAETAFNSFMQAAHKSVEIVPHPITDVSKMTLSMTEENIKAGFDHARKLLQTSDLNEFFRLQTEFLQAQFKTVQDQMTKLSSAMMAVPKTGSSVSDK
jgi:phasin